MWYCTNCGEENEGRFCVKCGTEYIEYESNNRVDPYNDYDSGYSYNTQPIPKSSRKGAVIAIIVVAALLIIGAGIGIFAISHDSGEPAEAAGTGIYYYVSSYQGTTNLYEDHNVDSAVLAVLDNSSPVEFIKEENSVFYCVQDPASGLIGYIRSDALVSSIEDVVSSDTSTEVSQISLGDYYVTGARESLALSDAPGNGKALAYVENGDCVALIEETSTKYWYVFDYGSGEYGYIQRGYLTDDPAEVKSGASVDVKPATPTSKTILADYMVDGTKNYLALRSAPSSSSTTEIGKTYNGNIVGLIEKTNSTFWYVYDYNSSTYGYVKCAYLTHPYEVYSNSSTLGENEYYVKGTKNYLALRSEPIDREEVEIGKTYNGNIVQVIEKTNDTYWYVLDYTGGIYGYVKCAYLSKTK